VAEHHGHPRDWLVTMRLAVTWRAKQAIITRIFGVAPKADFWGWLTVVMCEHVLTVRVQPDPFFYRPCIAVAARVVQSEHQVFNPVRSAIVDEVVACHDASARVEQSAVDDWKSLARRQRRI